MPEQTAAEKAAAASRPISLPAGSFDLADLTAAAKVINAAPDDTRQDVLGSELAKINQRVDDDVPPNALPGHKTETVERILGGVEEPKAGKAGENGETEIVGGVAVTETIQIFDPEQAEDEQAATEASAAGPAVAAPVAPAAAAAADEKK